MPIDLNGHTLLSPHKLRNPRLRLLKWLFKRPHQLPRTLNHTLTDQGDLMMQSNAQDIGESLAEPLAKVAVVEVIILERNIDRPDKATLTK